MPTNSLMPAQLKPTAPQTGLALYKGENATIDLSNYVVMTTPDGTVIPFTWNIKTVNPVPSGSSAWGWDKIFIKSHTNIAVTADYEMVEPGQNSPISTRLTNPLNYSQAIIPGVGYRDVTKFYANGSEYLVVNTTDDKLLLVSANTYGQHELAYVVYNVISSSVSYESSKIDIYMNIKGYLVRFNSGFIYHPLTGVRIGYADNLQALYNQADPVKASLVDNDSVKCSGYHCTYINREGKLNSFAYNSGESLATKTNEMSPFLGDIKKFVLSAERTMVLCSDGSLYGWGNDEYLQGGDPSNNWLVAMDGALSGKEIVDFAIERNSTLVLCSDGSLVSWGANYSDSLGTGYLGQVLYEKSNVTKLSRLTNYKKVKSINSYGNGFDILTTDGKLVGIGWGNEYTTEGGTPGYSIYQNLINLSCDNLPSGMLQTNPLKTHLITGIPEITGKYDCNIKAQYGDFTVYGESDPRNTFSSKATSYFNFPLSVDGPPEIGYDIDGSLINTGNIEVATGSVINSKLDISSSITVVSVSITGLPVGLTLVNNLYISGTVPQSISTYSCNVVLNYRTKSSSAVLTTNKAITITAKLGVPQVTIAGAIQSSGNPDTCYLKTTANKAVQIQVSGTNGPTSFAASGLPTGLSMNTSTGLISGTPTVNGMYAALITATNTAGMSEAKYLYLGAFDDPSILINTGNIEVAAGSSINSKLDISSAITVVSVSVTGLPVGLTLVNNLYISGTVPQSISTYSCSVVLNYRTASSNDVLTTNKAITITAKLGVPQVTIAGAIQSSGNPDTCYLKTTANKSVQIQVSGTNGPTSFAASGLPAGLSMNTSTGLISGTPTDTGMYAALITATNTAGTSEGKYLYLGAFDDPSILINTGNIEVAAGSVINSKLDISSSITVVSVSVTGLPVGLTLVNNLYISGTVPQSISTYSCNVVLNYRTGSSNDVLTTNKVITITAKLGVPQVAIAGAIQSSGNPDTCYLKLVAYKSVQIQVSGTNGPTSFAASGLPAGLSMNTSTGLISGTPTDTGMYAALITATNTAGTSEVKYLYLGAFDVAADSEFIQNAGIDIFFDIQTKMLSVIPPVAGVARATGQLFAKSQDPLILNLRIHKGYDYVDISPKSIRFGVATAIGSSLLMEGSSFTKVGSGLLAYYKMKINTNEAGFKELIDYYYDSDSVEQLDKLSGESVDKNVSLTTGICELLITTGTGNNVEISRSDTMPVTIKGCLL